METANPEQPVTPFWQRQFSPRATPLQIIFDVLFGMALPIICLYADPIVFQRSEGMRGTAALGVVSVFALCAVLLGLATIFVWLVFKPAPAFFSGLLAGGAVVAAMIGVVILPITIVGLFVLIGVLGFTPFATSFVFLRNSVRAYQGWAADSPQPAWRGFVPAALAGFFLALCLPWVAQRHIRNTIEHATGVIMSGNQSKTSEAVAELKRYRLFDNFDDILFAYKDEENPKRRARLAAVYFELTGNVADQVLNDLD